MALKISVFAPARMNHQAIHADAFKAGLARHGIAVDVLDPQSYKPCDLAVFWGHKLDRIINGQRAIGARYLVMERGYIGDRFKWTSLGYDGLNGRAEFPGRECGDRSRLDRHFPDLLRSLCKRPADGRTVVMGQVEGDAALAHVDINRWYSEVGYKIRMGGRAAYFRPHPLSRATTPARFLAAVGSLEQVFASAAQAVTFNSNSGVDAVVAGVPVVAYDQGSMAWDMASHDIERAPYRPSDAARADWAARLAWCQWSIKEISSGEAWARIGAQAASAPLSYVG